MRLFQKLKHSIDLLHQWEGSYAICGGIAACLYRESPRYTGDIDIAVINSPTTSATKIAENVIQALGYTPKLGFITDQYGKLIEKPALIMGREASETQFVGIDFLLPVLGWVEEAVNRAQLNKLDYGFAKVASIIPEDLIIAKLFALQGTPERRYDLDDILSIVTNIPNLDRTLLNDLVKKHDLRMPIEVQQKLEIAEAK